MRTKLLILLSAGLLLTGLGASSTTGCQSFSDLSGIDEVSDYAGQTVFPPGVPLQKGCEFIVKSSKKSFYGYSGEDMSNFYLRMGGPFTPSRGSLGRPFWHLRTTEYWENGETGYYVYRIGEMSEERSGRNSGYSTPLRPGEYSLDFYHDAEDANRYMDSSSPRKMRVYCSGGEDCDPVSEYITGYRPETCKTYESEVPINVMLNEPPGGKDAYRWAAVYLNSDSYSKDMKVLEFKEKDDYVAKGSLNADNIPSDGGQIIVEAYSPGGRGPFFYRGPVLEKTSEGVRVKPAPKKYVDGTAETCESDGEKPDVFYGVSDGLGNTGTSYATYSTRLTAANPGDWTCVWKKASENEKASVIETSDSFAAFPSKTPGANGVVSFEVPAPEPGDYRVLSQCISRSGFVSNTLEANFTVEDNFPDSSAYGVGIADHSYGSVDPATDNAANVDKQDAIDARDSSPDTSEEDSSSQQVGSWRGFCGGQGYEPNLQGWKSCISQSIVPRCFSGSAGESCGAIGNSICGELLDMRYDAEKAVCVSGGSEDG